MPDITSTTTNKPATGGYFASNQTGPATSNPQVGLKPASSPISFENGGKAGARFESIADSFAQAAQAIVPRNPGAGSSGQTSGSSSGSAPALDSLMSNPEQLVDFYNRDPEGFARFYKDLSADDKQMLMTRLNQEMQQTNQLFSLISNLLQASHQTARAVIQNLRV